MPVLSIDDRTPERRELDEQIASKPKRPIPDLPADTPTLPLDERMASLKEPRAIRGVVKNGVVRPLDAGVQLAENTRVLIITSPPA
jgi:hypothetical protein